jgi:hypothetical protein
MANANQNRDNDRAIEQELRLSRKFTIADAIGQEAGNFMKGESPVPRMVQVKTEIAQLLKQHLKDASGALQVVLQNWIAANEKRISNHLDSPAGAITEAITDILNSPGTLYELVRQADARWGQMYDERPHFQQPGQVAHPDDEYTHDSVRQALADCLADITSGYPCDISE